MFIQFSFRNVIGMTRPMRVAKVNTGGQEAPGRFHEVGELSSPGSQCPRRHSAVSGPPIAGVP